MMEVVENVFTLTVRVLTQTAEFLAVVFTDKEIVELCFFSYLER